MLDEVTELLAAVPDGVVIDATVGGGGHSEALLDANPRLSLLGIDRDDEAIASAAERLARHGDRVRLRRLRFDRLASALHETCGETWGTVGPDACGVMASGAGGGFSLADSQGARPGPSAEPPPQVRPARKALLVGALFDLGVSSRQLDDPKRGFSFRADGPLDMRMDRSQVLDAAALVNHADESTLARILRDNADEAHARRIARAIVGSRPITGTAQLAEAVAAALPARARRGRGHTARKTFQALRIEVNSELDVLAESLRTALGLLSPRGRCAVLSYHSGEDRIVKRVLREAAGEAPRPRPDLPPPPGSAATVRLLWRGVRTPSRQETDRNPRAAAARLRAVEKLGEAP